LGGHQGSTDWTAFTHDIARCDLKSTVTLISSHPDPYRYFGGSDIFVLPSREDPYPLVCLEAAVCGMPIICFDRGGGMPEFVEHDCGAVVPYLDIPAMAEQVILFATDEQKRVAAGEAAQAKVAARHDITIAAPQILRAMQKTALA